MHTYIARKTLHNKHYNIIHNVRSIRTENEHVYADIVKQL